MDRELLDAELIRDEKEVLFVYDDANGAPIKAGYTVKGNPTGGIGCNLLFLYPEESRWLLHNRQNRAIDELNKALPWFVTLDDVRQRALVNLYFNVPAFLHWPHFIGFMTAKEWEKAAAELESTEPWIREVGARGHRIAAMLRTGRAV